MTMKQPPQKDEGILDLLTNILKKSDVSIDDFNLLTKSVDIMSRQVLDMAKSIELLMTAIQNQNKAISDLYKIQEYLMGQLQLDVAPEQPLFIDTKKPKNEKPN